MAKRHPDEKVLRRQASKDFFANEVCWGLTIAMNIGMTLEQAMDYISADFDEWGNNVDWDNYT